MNYQMLVLVAAVLVKCTHAPTLRYILGQAKQMTSFEKEKTVVEKN